MFTVTFYKDKLLSKNIKYRYDLESEPLWQTNAVSIGSFVNKNLQYNNSFELGYNRQIDEPPEVKIPPYDFFTQCNVVKIEWESKSIDTYPVPSKVIGFITGCEYINDNNIKISYEVDPYMSALVSGVIDKENSFGIVERCNVANRYLNSNLQAEPFTPSDKTVVNKLLTANFNEAVFEFEGIPVNTHAISDYMKFVLIVSPLIKEYLTRRNINPYTEITASAISAMETGLLDTPTLNFKQNGISPHSGGYLRGHRLTFSTSVNVSDFIQKIMSGCGFRTVLDGKGVQGQDMVNYRQYVLSNNQGGGQIISGAAKNTANEPLEAVSFIDEGDIYNLFLLPTRFAEMVTNENNAPRTNGSSGTERKITGFKNLARMHGQGVEDNSKNKLLTHPYYYVKFVTANGDTGTIIPHISYIRDDMTKGIDTENDPLQVRLIMKFVGGECPRLMGTFAKLNNDDDTYLTDGGNNYDLCMDWFTIRNYPSIPLSIDNSFNLQIQRDIANTQKLSSEYNNARTQNQIDHPVKQAYLDERHGVANRNPAQNSGLGNLLNDVGSLMGKFDNWGSPMAGNFFDDKALNTVNQSRNAMQAGNFIDPQSTYISGNDFMSQIFNVAFSCYDCGATDTEAYAFCRFIDEYGSSVNMRLNPFLNTTGGGGYFEVIKVNERTYYQFAHIEIRGVMPIDWKIGIKQLFESGVYIYDEKQE